MSRVRFRRRVFLRYFANNFAARRGAASYWTACTDNILKDKNIWGVKGLDENFVKRVDAALGPSKLAIPLNADPEVFGVFYAHLGLQIELNFVPASAKATAASRRPERRIGGTRLSFFVTQNGRKSWFFDIYIQGSKKVQL